MQAMDKVIKARAGLILDNPFFGSLALRLKLTEDPSCKTAWTDGAALGFNPDFINELSISEAKGLLAHEVMHCAAAHHCRRGERDAKKWNIAGDYAINDILTESGFVLPAGALLADHYKNKSADEIYNALPDSPDQGGGGQGDAGGNDPGNCGEVRDCPGKNDGAGKAPASPADKAQQEQNWKIAVNQAAQQAKTRQAGALPGGLARLVDDIINPRLDWSELLRQFVDQAAKNDYSWTRPNRRHIAAGLYLPGLYSQELGQIVVAIDTSGSVSKDELQQFAAEISAILETFQAEITVLYCDTKIAGKETFTSQDLPLALNAAGGGGTRFTPVFEDVTDTMERPPTCLVYLTDMACNDYPDQTPGYPVLWISTAGGPGCYGPPPFGDVVEMN